MAQKIATCCYCGTRAALVLTGETQHHLSCGSCGAPLSRIKHLKAEAAPAPMRTARPARPQEGKEEEVQGAQALGRGL